MENASVTFIKGYELRERIGAGGFGAVYKAYQSTVGREVAMKIILPHYANHPEFIRRFETEAQLVARLEHPYITPLYDYWRDPDGAYLVMRFLRGGSLREALENGPYTLEAAMTLLDQITTALAVAHRNNVIHRDIKPANILLDEDGNAYLGDFGIAKDIAKPGDPRNGTQPDAVIGSLDYISPEQARSDAVTPRTDIYSLGVVLYEMLCGEHPFPNLNAVERLFKHVSDPLPFISSLPADKMDAVNAVIQRATAKNPELRFADALEFAQAFRQAVVPGQTANLVETLTLREQDILTLMIEGRSNKEIAQALYITLATVKWYINQIYRKLGVRSRVQAIVRARELKLISTDHAENGVKGDEGHATVIHTDLFMPENPYKGLRAFEAADAQDFFGRENLVEKLIQRMSGVGAKHVLPVQSDEEKYARFLAVVGPSGSGKSSLVKAGLIPAIWRGDLPGSEKWFVVEMLPGAHPLDELEIALTRIAANQSSSLNEQLRRDERGLLRTANLILPNDHSELLMVVDQFEEVFTLVETEAERVHFLKLIYAAVTEPRSRIRIVVTLRADFYDRPLRYPEIGELIRARMETVLPLGAKELEAAIIKPAVRVGVMFEEGLVATIVSEINYQAGALPLLQYALTELFEQREGRLLSYAAYQAAGRAGGALAKRADNIYNELPPQAQELARQMFLRLVTLGEGVEDTRRRTARAELLAVGGEDMDEIVDTFAEYRLLSLDSDPGTRTPTVEVAHEALLREWERLRAWLNDSRDAIKLQRQLAAMAAEWRGAAGEASFLARGSRLEQFERWAAETKLALTAQEHEYLDASVSERERQQAAEKTRQTREKALERRVVRFLRVLVAVLLLATLGAFGLTGFALSERNQSQANFALSESQRLAAEANLLLAKDGSNELAALLSIHALQSAYSPQADMALQRAAQQSFGERIFSTPTDIAEVAYAPDGNAVLFALYSGTVQLYDVVSGDLRWESTQFTGAPWIAISPDNRFALVSDGVIHLLDMATGEEVRQFTNPLSGEVGSAVFSPDGRSILAVGEDSSWIQNVQTGKILRQFDGAAFDAAFSPDGNTVAALNTDGIVRLWDSRSGYEIRQLSIPSQNLFEAAFSPDGRYLAVSADKTAYILAVETGEQLHELVGHSEHVKGLAFSPDGHYLATSCMDGSARLWDVATGLEVRRFTAHRTGLFTLAFSPDGRYLLTGSRDASARLWDLQTPVETSVLVGTPGFSYGIVYSLDGRYLATASARDIHLWDNTTEQLIRTFSVPDLLTVRSIMFSPDGRYLLAVDKTVHLFEVQSGETVHVWDNGGQNGAAIFTPDGREILVSTPKAMIFYHVETGEQVRQFATPQGNQYLTYSPDHRYLLTTGPLFSARDAYLWDAQTGEQLRTFTGHTKDIHSLAFTPDGRYVVAGSDDSTVIFWDVQTGAVSYTLTGHTQRIYALAFTADGRTLLTGSLDGTARLWDWQSGHELRRYIGQGIVSTVFSPNEQQVLIGNSDGKVYITPARIEVLVQSVCRRVLRDLTPAERIQYLVRNEEPTCSDLAQ